MPRNDSAVSPRIMLGMASVAEAMLQPAGGVPTNVGPTTANTGPMARFTLTNDGSDFDVRTQAFTFLYCMTPNFWQDNISYHDCAEESYHIWGTSWMMQFGDLPTGGYFWRPPYINHGAFGCKLGTLAIGRTDSRLYNHFHYNPWTNPKQNLLRALQLVADGQRPRVGEALLAVDDAVQVDRLGVGRRRGEARTDEELAEEHARVRVELDVARRRTAGAIGNAAPGAIVVAGSDVGRGQVAGLARALCDAASKRLGQPNLPDQYFKQAIAAYPQEPMTYVVHGMFLQKRGRTADAIGQYERAVSLNPNLPDAHYNLGLALVQAKRYAEANTHAVAAYRLGHPMPGLRNQLQRVGAWNPDAAEPASPAKTDANAPAKDAAAAPATQTEAAPKP